MFKVIDLFAGPGGLAEGFSAIPGQDGQPVFDIALSVEKEPSAFGTLRLRSFVRRFGQRIPENYERYITREMTLPEFVATSAEHAASWGAAIEETEQLTLGTDSARRRMNLRLRDIERTTGRDSRILIGGPPCQAYSLVGRARNRGIAGYDAGADHRHFLYQEYIDILERLEPAAFVMENVKGLLSSRVNGHSIFERIIEDLKGKGYRLIPLSGSSRGSHSYVVRAEEFGVPQARHRVILLGIRNDLAALLPVEILSQPGLQADPTRPSVSSVLKGLPPLRSGLSKSADGSKEWQNAAATAFRTAAGATAQTKGGLQLAAALRELAARIAATPVLPERSSTGLPPVGNGELALWLRGRGLSVLPNHQTRGHMEADLARYAFAAAFAELHGSSPKAGDYPLALAPEHANWESGKFADRFRVQQWDRPSTTVTSHISKDGHYFIHPDPLQCRSLTVREAARLQTFPDDYFFEGNRTEQFVQVGNAVPPFLAKKIATMLASLLQAVENARADNSRLHLAAAE